MPQVFLIGGGGDHPERTETYGRFLQAATQDRRKLALVVAAKAREEAEDTFVYTRDIFTEMGLSPEEVCGLFLDETTPLTTAMLAAEQPTGLFVCGGMTPLYHDVLCRDQNWLQYLETNNIPYGGVSAGAAVAANRVIVGGWQAQHRGITRAILFQGASEGLDMLDLRRGLGLVPFTVEIHASQWGTLTRLLHAIDLDLVSEGWAIDENTLLQIEGTSIHVYGTGHSYHLQRAEDGATSVSVYRAPEQVPKNTRS